MDYKIQLLSFFVSFIFGIFFYILSVFNYKLINKYNKLMQYILTFVYMIFISLCYTYLLFKINNGNIHPYFLLLVLAGFVLTNQIKKVLIKNVKFYEKIVKHKRKWYNLGIIRVIIWVKGYQKKIKED